MASPSRSQACLSDMPVDIKLLICEAITPDQRTICLSGNGIRLDQVSLSRLSRTNRQFRDIAQRLVFRHFNGTRDKSRLVSFLRALHRRPDLAQAVQQLDLCDPGLEGSDLSSLEMRFIHALLCGLSLTPVHPQWSPNDGDPETRLLLPQLILLHTRNVQNVHLAIENGNGLSFLRQIHDAQPNEIIFPKLTSLDITLLYIAGDNFDVPLDEIACAIFPLAPNLTHLSLPSFEGHYNPNPLFPPKKPYALQSLRHLSMGPTCAASPELLGHLLTSSPSLQSIRMHWDPIAQHYDSTEGWTVARMWETLRTHCVGGGKNLRELNLYIGDTAELGTLPADWRWTPRKDTIEGGGGGLLGNFESLEVLRIENHALEVMRAAVQAANSYVEEDELFIELLPLGIRKVVFWNLEGKPASRRALERLAREVPRTFLGLRSVVLAGTPNYDVPGGGWSGARGQIWWQGAEPELARIFARVGVVFRVKEAADGTFWYQGTGCMI